ncbi:MAG: hypothetical protein ACI31C_02870 [Muribaculaceae bacterium]
MFKRTILTIILLLSVASFASAAAQSSVLSPDDRQRWLSEIRTYKHDFLARELDLSREQQNEFFPLYDEMEDRIEALNAQARDIEANVSDNPDAGDLEILGAAYTQFELKKLEGEIELEFYDKFKEILNPRQLLQLKSAEKLFTRQLVNRRNQMRQQPLEQK